MSRRVSASAGRGGLLWSLSLGFAMGSVLVLSNCIGQEDAIRSDVQNGPYARHSADTPAPRHVAPPST